MQQDAEIVQCDDATISSLSPPHMHCFFHFLCEWQMQLARQQQDSSKHHLEETSSTMDLDQKCSTAIKDDDHYCGCSARSRQKVVRVHHPDHIYDATTIRSMNQFWCCRCCRHHPIPPPPLSSPYSDTLQPTRNHPTDKQNNTTSPDLTSPTNIIKDDANKTTSSSSLSWSTYIKSGRFLRSVVFGGLDGLTTSVVLICSTQGLGEHFLLGGSRGEHHHDASHGTTAAASSNSSISSSVTAAGVLFTLGVANLIADAFSMGMGDYLSSLAEKEANDGDERMMGIHSQPLRPVEGKGSQMGVEQHLHFGSASSYSRQAPGGFQQNNSNRRDDHSSTPQHQLKWGTSGEVAKEDDQKKKNISSSLRFWRRPWMFLLFRNLCMCFVFLTTLPRRCWDIACTVYHCNWSLISFLVQVRVKLLLWCCVQPSMDHHMEAFRNGVVMFAAFVFFGCIPLICYSPVFDTALYYASQPPTLLSLLHKSSSTDTIASGVSLSSLNNSSAHPTSTYRFHLSLVFGAFSLFLLGVLKGHVTTTKQQQSNRQGSFLGVLWCRKGLYMESGFLMVLTGGIASMISYILSLCLHGEK